MHSLRLTCLLVLTRPPLGQIYCAFFFLFFSLTRLRPESCKTRNDLSRPDLIYRGSISEDHRPRRNSSMINHGERDGQKVSTLDETSIRGDVVARFAIDKDEIEQVYSKWILLGSLPRSQSVFQRGYDRIIISKWLPIEADERGK